MNEDKNTTVVREGNSNAGMIGIIGVVVVIAIIAAFVYQPWKQTYVQKDTTVITQPADNGAANAGGSGNSSAGSSGSSTTSSSTTTGSSGSGTNP